MKLIKPSFEILNEEDLERATREIERVARTCYKSEYRICDGSDLEFVRRLLNYEPPHEAMIEFGPSITVKFICDRGVSHELVRHRIASFAQESTRYCNYANKDHIEFIIPPWTKFKENKEYVINVPSKDPEMIWLRAMSRAEIDYKKMIEIGWVPQQARSVLPNSLKTEINIKANIREWRHIFKLRCSKAAHPQMRELMIPLLIRFKLNAAVLFDDI